MWLVEAFKRNKIVAVVGFIYGALSPFIILAGLTEDPSSTLTKIFALPALLLFYISRPFDSTLGTLLGFEIFGFSGALHLLFIGAISSILFVAFAELIRWNLKGKFRRRR